MLKNEWSKREREIKWKQIDLNESSFYDAMAYLIVYLFITYIYSNELNECVPVAHMPISWIRNKDEWVNI